MKKYFNEEKELKKALESGDASNSLVLKEFVTEKKTIDTENLTIDFVISSSTIDRMHDTIDQSGWDLKAYKKNPVILWAHDQCEPPIAKAIPKALRVDGKTLKATAQFMNKDLSEFSFMIFQMYQHGFMNATSVGFRPLEWSYAEDDNRPYGINFTKQELLEFSCVPVPANAEALQGAKSMGIDTRPLKTWAEQVLDTYEDNGHDILVPKHDIEKLFKTLSNRVRLVKTIKIENEITPEKNVVKAEDTSSDVIKTEGVINTSVVTEESESTSETVDKAVETKATTINRAGVTHANSLVDNGHVNKTAGWSFSSDDGNALLGPDDDWTNYGKNFLGKDPAASTNTKAYFKYPVSKGGQVYRSGVIAAKQRAAAQGATDIETAADNLLTKIDGKDYVAPELKEVTDKVERLLKEANVEPNDVVVSAAKNPPLHVKALALHKTATNLITEALQIHTKANDLFTKALNPDNPADGSGDDYSDPDFGKSVDTIVEKQTSSVAGGLEANPPYDVEGVRLAIALHKTAIYLGKQAMGVHTAALDIMNPLMDPDDDNDIGDTDDNTPDDDDNIDDNVKAVEPTKEIIAKTVSDEDVFLTIFEDSVDNDEDSVNFDEVKELLLSLDLGTMIEESLKAKLDSKI